MHQLVPDDVIVVHGDSGEREKDPSAEAFRYPAFTRGDETGHGIGLLEIGKAVVEDDFLRSVQPGAEQRGMMRIPLLQHPCGVLRRRRALRVVIDLEMRCGEHEEIQLLPGHLVAAELLGGDRRPGDDQHEDDEQPGRGAAAAVHIPACTHFRARKEDQPSERLRSRPSVPVDFHKRNEFSTI